MAAVARNTAMACKNTKLGQGNIFRSVCQEICPRGGACVAVCVAGGGLCGRGGHAWQAGGYVWWGACMARGACVAEGVHGRGVCVAYSQRAGGTHPTGMHSCYTVQTIEAKL